MKLCNDHYEKLKTAIRTKKMWHLVSKSGEEAVNRFSSPVIDPLFNSCMNIYTNALHAGGLQLLDYDENGKEYCPLCELNKHGTVQNSDDWIDLATEDMLIYCKDNNLLNIEN
jgi:hypothetical protein